MKRFMTYGILMILMIASSTILAAEEKSPEKVSSLIVIKNDWVKPQNGKGYFSQTFSGYWHYRWIGGGIDVTHTPQNKYYQVQPFLTVNKGPFYALCGYSGDSVGATHVQTGAWYVNTHKKFLIIADLRNFWSVDQQKGRSYLDLWMLVSHPLGKHFYAGVEGEYIHWWEKKPHNWYFVGPLVGVNLTKKISLYVRPSLEWDIAGRKIDRTFRTRVGIKFNF